MTLWVLLGFFGWLHAADGALVPAASLMSGFAVALGVGMGAFSPPKRILASRGLYLLAALLALATAAAGKYLAVQIHISREASRAVGVELSEGELRSMGGGKLSADEVAEKLHTGLRDLLAEETATFEGIDLLWFALASGSAVLVTRLLAGRTG